jgi:hypothetical protein
VLFAKNEGHEIKEELMSVALISPVFKMADKTEKDRHGFILASLRS